MKKTLERHNQTVLVIEGHPYSLVREINPTSNGVCNKCDLREKCNDDPDYYNLWDLCTPECSTQVVFE